ncbi:MAG: hypothetical protein KIS74_02290 [Burkholderiales bacterium]|nr:hypothetical protein [Burkholderiales bacterium]
MDPSTVSLKGEPPAQVFVISPEFLEPECAVVTLKDIDAMIAGLVVEGCDDSTWHDASDGTSDDKWFDRCYPDPMPRYPAFCLPEQAWSTATC